MWLNKLMELRIREKFLKLVGTCYWFRLEQFK